MTIELNIGIAGLIGCSLAFIFIKSASNEAKNLELKIDSIMRHLGINFDPTEHIPADVKNEAISGNRIKAIKMYRQKTGAGLKEAIDAVDQVISKNNK